VASQGEIKHKKEYLENTHTLKKNYTVNYLLLTFAFVIKFGISNFSMIFFPKYMIDPYLNTDFLVSLFAISTKNKFTNC
jgi:hypothetical protein